MSFDLSTLTLNQFGWLILIILGVVAVFVVVRFFLKHVVKWLVTGCVTILVIVGILALLHYFRVF